ncbi:MAG: hypothetical protein GY788_21095 [bacterium]|nr:hypothetical protein [bacterium]
MAKVFRKDRLTSGAVVAVDEINANLTQVAGEMNGGLDRENVPAGVITTTEVKAGCFNQILWKVGDGAPEATLDAKHGEDKNMWRDIPGYTDEFLTEDGRFEIEAHVQLDTAGLYEMELGVRVDGEIVAQSGSPVSSSTSTSIYFQKRGFYAIGAPAVGAGNHQIELVWRGTAGKTLGATITYDFNAVQLWVRFLRR